MRPNTATLYHVLEWPLEILGAGKWRQRAWSGLSGRILEVGIGTGRNLPFYPEGVLVTGIDRSPDMVRYSSSRARSMGVEVDIHEMDLLDLGFPDNTFDNVICTFVFCQVGDYSTGLKEIKRVCRPGGRIVFLEHVGGRGLLGRVLSLLDPVTLRWGESFSRNTGLHLREADLIVESETPLLSDVVILFETRIPNGEESEGAESDHHRSHKVSSG